MYKLLLALLFFVLTFSAFAEKPVLRVVAQQWQGATNADFTGYYWDIVRAVYGDDYQLEFEILDWRDAIEVVEKQQADIVIGVYKDQNPGLITPSYHFDRDSAFYLLFNAEDHQITKLADIRDLTIAGRDEYLLKTDLPSGVKFYPISSPHNINKLIFNAKIDGALLYANELNVADPSGTLNHVEVLPKRKMYLGFQASTQGEKLAKIYDHKMPELVTKGTIKQLFTNQAAYQFAGYHSQQTNTSIDWYLVPKLVDKDQSLNTVPIDHHLTDVINKHVSPFELNIKIGNMRVINDVISPNTMTTSSCAINIIKRPQREQYSVFSDPVNIYLKPRLITLTNQKLPVNHLGAVNLAALLTEQPSFKVGLIRQSVSDELMKQAMPEALYDKLFWFEGRVYKKLLSLLFAQRLDAVILWPTTLPEIMPNINDAQRLSSYAVTPELGRDMATYVMCNDTDNSEKFIAVLNQALNSPKVQQEMYQYIIKHLDTSSGVEYKRALNLKY